MSPININSNPFASANMYSKMKNISFGVKFETGKQNIKKQPETEKSEKQLQVEQIMKDMARIREGNAVSALDAKLKAGGELTDKELDYLKEKNPELYQKAMEIKREREAYKKELENCKSKEDLEELYSRKMQGFMTEIKNIKSNPNISGGKKKEMIEQILRRAAGITTEHTKFLTSEKGEKLMLKDKERSKGNETNDKSAEIEALKLQVQSAEKTAEAMAEDAKTHSKCLTIAMRIMAGDKVPREDYNYLAKHDPGLFSTAITHRIQKSNPKEYKRLSEDESDNASYDGSDSIGSVKDASEVAAPVAADVAIEAPQAESE